MQWPSERLFFAAATAALISSVAMFSMRWTLKPGEIK